MTHALTCAVEAQRWETDLAMKERTLQKLDPPSTRLTRPLRFLPTTASSRS